MAEGIWLPARVNYSIVILKLYVRSAGCYGGVDPAQAMSQRDSSSNPCSSLSGDSGQAPALVSDCGCSCLLQCVLGNMNSLCFFQPFLIDFSAESMPSS